jgi:hypothetical protein
MRRIRLRWKRLVWLVWTAFFLMLSARTAAQVSSGFDLSWNFLSSGGGEHLAASYRMEDAIGGWVVGKATSPTYSVDPGFLWSSPAVEAASQVYLPILVCSPP